MACGTKRSREVASTAVVACIVPLVVSLGVLGDQVSGKIAGIR